MANQEDEDSWVILLIYKSVNEKLNGGNYFVDSDEGRNYVSLELLVLLFLD